MGQAAEKKIENIQPLAVKIHSLGLRSFREIWEIQRDYQRQLIAGTGDEHLIICQHPAVVTLGRSADPENLLITPQELARRGVELISIERGGDVTYHGPGQLVAYPILDLRKRKPDVGWYMRTLEEIIINTLKRYNIESFRITGRTGVWTYKKAKDISSAHLNGASPRVAKIASIGVRMSRWCTLHGLALNVEDCTEGFSLINPCGYSDIEVSSMSEYGAADLVGVSKVLEENFLAAFGSISVPVGM